MMDREMELRVLELAETQRMTVGEVPDGRKFKMNEKGSTYLKIQKLGTNIILCYNLRRKFMKKIYSGETCILL